MPHTLDSILDAIQKTGDRCIVFDKNAGLAFLVTPLVDESINKSLKEPSLENLTNTPLLAKINAQIEKESNKPEQVASSANTTSQKQPIGQTGTEFLVEPIE